MRKFSTAILLMILLLDYVSMAAASEPTQTFLTDDISLRGPLAQGGFVVGQAPIVKQIRLNDQIVHQTPDGHFAFGFGRDAAAEATLQFQFKDDTERRFTLPIANREFDTQYITGVPHRTVSPDPEHLKRIRSEAALVGQARKQHHELSYFIQPFIWPAQGRITGVYGSQRFYNGEPRSPHYGVDIAGPTGAPVIAPADGIVTLTHPDMFFSGGTLIIDHGYGITSTFIHLHRILVEEGDRVTQGQPIAEIGATGRATGPHLDWRMNWYRVRLDPQLFMPPMPDPGSR